MPGRDYGKPGGYFVTIRLQDRTIRFGDIRDAVMHPNEIGRIVASTSAIDHRTIDHRTIDHRTIDIGHQLSMPRVESTNALPSPASRYSDAMFR